MNRYDKAKKFILEKLKTELPQNLYYHGLHHVLDVLGAADLLGEKENIPARDMELLRIAVLFHDSGYTINSTNHEKLGCEIARKHLPAFNYTEEEINSICGMIMATKFPH